MNLLPDREETRWSIRKKGKHVFNICTRYVALHSLALAFLAMSSSAAHANPAGGVVAAGTATISSSGREVDINQTSSRAIINWNSFDISSNETTRFIQPGATSLTLNRVTTGSQASFINGNLLANGHVLVINPNGVLIGPHGNVDVAGFVASSADIADNAFVSGASALQFDKAGRANAVVENQGHITVEGAGLGLLVAPTVKNSGVIEGSLSRLQMGAGDTFGVDLYGDGLLNLAVTNTRRTLNAENTGRIIASGGKIVMTAAAASGVVDSVINTSGVVEAHTLVNQGGQIILKGEGATVNVSGTVDASAPQGGAGGFIETSGDHVHVADGTIITTFAAGGNSGTWLIDPNDYKISASGGDITGATLGANLNSGNVTILSSTGATAGSGDINVNDSVSWTGNTTLTLSAYRNVNVNADITATGNTAGLTLTPNTGAGGGNYSLNNGAVITLSGSAPSLNIAGNAYTVINDLTALQNMSTNLSGYYALGSDIDASATSAWNAGAGFAPIGGGTEFDGLFDGLNHSISNLYINRPTESYVGLFGYVYGGAGGGVIRNLGLHGGSITGDQWVGALAGAVHLEIVTNAYASANVTAMDQAGGGLIGYISESTVSNSHATGGVAAGTYAGGLVGLAEIDSNISNSYATGDVSSVSSAGGLVGSAVYDTTISNSYSTGNVTGASSIGGFIGGNSGGSSISDSYSTGDVTGSGAYAGGFAGSNDGSASITRSYSTGAVTGGDNYTGGFVGANSAAEITNSFATSAVTVNNMFGVVSYIGGFAGVNNQSGSISDSYASGAVTGVYKVGGFTGMNEDNSVIARCYAMGAVAGNADIGGLVGVNRSGASISNSYATGAVTGYGGDVGGLVGLNSGASISTSYATGIVPVFGSGGLVGSSVSGTVTNSFWDTDTSGTATSPGGTGKTITQMMTQSTFTSTGWDFTNTWWMSDGNTRPFLRMEWSGNIINAHQLQLMAMNLGANYTLAADIDMSELTNPSGLWGSAKGFVPVGNLYSGSFQGQFNGMNHVIDGLYINRPTEDEVGLFGYVEHGVLSNVGIENSSVTGHYQTGTLVGYSTELISNSYATGTVSGFGTVGGLAGLSYYADVNTAHFLGTVNSGDGDSGGLLGLIDHGTISNSYSTATVTSAGSVVGGLVAFISDASVDGSYATGNVNGSSAVGGLIGRSFGGTVQNSYASGNVHGTGGMIGGLLGDGDGNFVHDYATGNVSAGGMYVGGLIGNVGQSSPIVDSYATGNVTSIGGDVGGLAGNSSAAISNSYATGNVTGSYVVGGLVGYQSSQLISNSYAKGDVSGNSAVGGFIGDISYGSGISNSYSTGAVSASSSSGGFAGAKDDFNAVVANSFWDITTSGQAIGTSIGSSAGMTGLTTAQMMQQSSFTGFDFTNVWKIYDGHTYPLLKSFMTPLTITANNSSKTYDALGWASALDVTGYSDPSVAGSPLIFGLDTPYGAGKNNVGVNNASVWSTQLGYDITMVGGQLTVTPVALTVSGGTVASKIYDGTASATITGASLTGVLASDAVTVIGNFSDKNVGTSKTVTASLGGADGGNYTFTAPGGLTADITPFALTVGATGINRIYDSTTAATVSLSDNRFAGDVFTDSYTSAAYANKNAGTGKAVSVSGISISGTDAGNYTVNTTASTTANITPFALTVGATGINKIYDRTTGATVSLSDNRFAGDVFTDSYTAAAYANKNAGNNKTISVSGIGISGTDAGNYTVNTTASTTANITPFALTVSATGVNKVYNTTTAATVTLSNNKFAGDVVNNSYTTAAFSDKNAGTGKTVSVSGISISGADAGNYTFNTTTSTTANITPFALTISATGVSKVYDSTTGATVNLSDNRFAGDVFTRSYTASFASKNVGNSKAISVSGIGISGTDAGNYTFNTTASTTANITPFALTIGATGINRIYNSTTGATVSLSDNRFAGDVFSDSYTGASFGTKDVGNGKAVSVSGISISGTDAGNYTFNTTASTTANITPFALTVGATGVNRIYDSTTGATVSLTDNRFAGDVFSDSYTGASFASKNVGNGKTVSVSGISISGTDAGNYTFNTTASTTANITPFALTVGATGNNRIYDSTTGATVNLSDNRFAGDVFTDSYTGASFASKNVGNGKAISISGISISGADAGNYTFNSTASATANITPFALTVGATGNNRVYDSTTGATVSLSDNRFAGDVFSDSYTSASFASKNVGNGKTVSVSGISISGTDAGNYTFNTTASATANITPFALTIGAMGNNKVYDSTTDATVSLSDNRFAGDVFSDSYTGASFVDKNVGNGKAVSVSGISISGTDAGNYTFNSTASAVANIIPYALTVSATGSDKIYDATTGATASLDDDRFAGDVFTDAYAAASFANKNVGNGKAVSVTGIGISGADAGNYTFNTTASTTANITPFALTIGATGVNKVYDGTANASVTLGDNRFAGDNLATTYASASFADGNAGVGKAVSVSGISLGGSDAGNYSVNTTATATAGITPKALTVIGTLAAANRVYDGTVDETVTGGTLSGIIGADSVQLAGLFANKNAGTKKAVTLALSGGDAGNYSLSSSAHLTATIARASLVTGVIVADKVYDGTTTASATYTDNRVAGDAISISGAAKFAAKTAGTDVVVKISSLKVTGADAGNYTLVSRAAAGSADITQRSITITANNLSMLLGAKIPPLTYTIGDMGLAPRESLRNVFTGALQPTGTGLGANAIIQGTLTSNGNYVITSYTPGVLTVTH